MKLARIGDPGQERLAIVVDEGLVAVDDLVPSDDGRSITVDDIGVLAEHVRRQEFSQRPVLDPSSVRYGPPVRPSKIVCIGLNFADHAREGGMEPPSEPVIFMKAPNCVVGPDDDVILPPGSQATDYEVELAIVIGRETSYLPTPESARDVIAGFAISDDVSERHWQLERGGTWDKGKCFATFNPLGPWLVTPDEIDDIGDLAMELAVNGELRQESSTRQMIFGVDHLVWYVSQFMTLEPGDIINTGTPAGVGLGFDPPRYLTAGDVVDVRIEGLGQQRHVFRPHATTV